MADRRVAEALRHRRSGRLGAERLNKFKNRENTPALIGIKA